MSDCNKKDPNCHIKELGEILKESGAKVTFDPYRDTTKGCGDHCKGMNKTRTELCKNHMEAVMRGDYCVAGGSVDEVKEVIMMQRDSAQSKAALLDQIIKGEVTTEQASELLRVIDDELQKKLPRWAK